MVVVAPSVLRCSAGLAFTYLSPPSGGAGGRAVLMVLLAARIDRLTATVTMRYGIRTGASRSVPGDATAGR